MKIPTTLAYAQERDKQDPLAEFRDRFLIDDPDLIYLDGNSLGRLPQETAVSLNDLIQEQWGKRLIHGWNEGWIELPGRIGDKLGRLMGAAEDEVILADSTSINLFKLAVAALQTRPQRHKIVTDDMNFPSDLYVIQGLTRLLGRELQLEIVPSPDGVHAPMAALAEAIDGDTALVTLSHVAFKSSYLYEMTAVTEMAHDAGALMLWDLSHAAGAVPIDLNGSDVDLAVGCTYKYINGGPGAPAFLYVRRDLQETLANPISGWMGQQNMFDFDLAYTPAPGLRRFLTGTPPVLSLAAVEPGVDLLLEAGMDRVRSKSVQQTDYLIGLWQALLAPLGFHLNSPPHSKRRGAHVSLGHPEAGRIVQALIEEMNVIPDFRRPDNLRLGIASLYNSFTEVWTAVNRLETVVDERLYEQYDPIAAKVT